MTKPTLEQILKAVLSMSRIIPFFPKEELERVLIAGLIERFVNTEEELQWLVMTACGHIRDWERSGGVAELRGLFCTRFEPADKIAQYCSTPGFRAEDLEAKFFSQEREENDRRLEEFKRKAELEGEPAAFPLPDVKRLN